MSADDVTDTGKVAFCGRLTVDYTQIKPRMVRWSDDVFSIKDGRVITNAEAYIDDGSAAHEPDRNLSVNVLIDQLDSVLDRNESLMAEIAMMREFVSRLPEDDGAATPNGVQADIDRVCDHLLHGDTDVKQRTKLRTSVDRAERVRPGSDAAVGRAIKEV